MQNVPVQGSNELGSLYAEKGEIVTQLEVAQGRLQQINMRLSQLLGLNQVAAAPQR